MKHIILAAAVMMAGSAFADNHGKKSMDKMGKKAAAHKAEKAPHGDMKAEAPAAPAAPAAPEKK